ncbi:MAG TPA: folate-binding protein [Trichocoleus sp.]|jgi:folate-binding protein YgfZ
MTKQELQKAYGAEFMTVAEVEVPAHFGNDQDALQTIEASATLYDRSHWGRILVTGDDRLRFLHNQTTNNFQILEPGQGCDTVFVNPTARTIDLVTAYVLEDAVLLLTSPGYAPKLIAWMDQYIFFADKVDLKDITSTTAAFSLMGSESDALLQGIGGGAIMGESFATHQMLSLGGVEVRVAAGSGLAIPGYTLIVEAEQAALLWKALVEAGATPIGEQAWNQLRILQGRPLPGQELTEDYNPLEAGLWYTISLNKGCYIGQETIARLHTYKGVKQQLWGIKLTQPTAPQSTITVGEERVGILTSYAQTPEGHFGLAYIRTKAIVPDLKVQVGEAQGTLVPLPFLNHEYL